MAGARALGATLARVADLLAGHHIVAAERLLADLLADGSALAAAPRDQRCRVFIEWGWIHGATQRYETARQALATAVELAEELRPRNLLCEALRESGIVARYQGDFRRADGLLERSELIARQDGYDLELGQALFLRATIAHHQARFAVARDLLQQATEAARRCAPIAEARQLLGDIFREQAVSARVARDYDTARGFLIQAREEYEALGRRVGIANADRELGAVYESLGDDASAYRHYFSAFSAYLRTGRRIGAAQVARRAGHLDLMSGVTDSATLSRAKRRFAQALRLGGGEPGNAVLTTIFQGRLARMEGDLEAADRLLGDAVRICSLLEQDPGVVRDLSQIALEYGRVARERGDRTQAISFFRQALAVLHDTDDPGPASLAHYELAFELIQADEVASALKHAIASFTLNEANGRRLHDPAERRSFYVRHSETYSLAMHCAARAQDGHAALTVAMAARSEALAAFVRAGARLAPQLKDLIDEISLTAAEAERREPDVRHTAPGRLQELYVRLEHEASRQMRQAMTEKGADAEEAIASLPAGGYALLLDVLEEDNTICNRVWVSPGGKVTVDEVIFPQRVRHFLDSYHAGRYGAAWRPQQDDLAELGQAVVPPGLAAAIAAGANPALVISTGSLLSPVPVAALRVNGRYLAEQAQLALVPSFALWASLRTRPARAGHGTLAFLDTGLPGWRREEAALRAALAPLHLAGPGELRDRLADATTYAAVVISAHGLPSHTGESGGESREHPNLAQALALGASDRLTAAELLTCRLPDALITPSCWSGRLTVRVGAEPLGLPTAALIAGARWVLAGTVDIGSTPTASLMSAFYRNLNAGLTPAAALQAAQVKFLRIRPHTAPGTWAGLTIVGDGFRAFQTPPLP